MDDRLYLLAYILIYSLLLLGAMGLFLLIAPHAGWV